MLKNWTYVLVMLLGVCGSAVGQDLVIYSSGKIEGGGGVGCTGSCGEEDPELLSLSILDEKGARKPLPERVFFGSLSTLMDVGKIRTLKGGSVREREGGGVVKTYGVEGFESEGAVFKGEVYGYEGKVVGWKLETEEAVKGREWTSPFRAERVLYRSLKYSVRCSQGRGSKAQLSIAEVSPRSVAVAKLECKSDPGKTGSMVWRYRGSTMGQSGKLVVEYSAY